MEQKQDMVNHPKHYTYLNELCGVEPINICRNFNFVIGNALKATFNGQTLFTWKTGKGRKTFDSKRFKAEYPDIYSEYIKVSQGNRTFLIK